MNYNQIQVKDEMENKLQEAIKAAMDTLWFPPVFEDVFENTDIYDEGDYFYQSDGTPLKGRMVLYSGEIYEEKVSNDVEFFSEVFLTEEGKLIKFYTVKESLFCQECNEIYTSFHRMIAKDQSLDDREIDTIQNNIYEVISLL